MNIPTVISLVQSNLWGMETRKEKRRERFRSRFNRIYEEWKHVSHITTSRVQVCSIESMRNGNCRFVFCSWQGRWFNRIYEEWKPWFPSLLRGCLFSSIESMRNGNTHRQIPQLSVTLVQSNLWGMETRSRFRLWTRNELFNRIYEEWKPSK